MTMPTRRKQEVQRLDYSEATKMLRAGSTQEEVAARFGVTQSAVSLAISRGRIKHDTGYVRRLPWHVKREHANMAIPRALRLALRFQQGDETLSPRLRSDAEGFLRKLDELDAVIAYEPEVEPYWFRVPRRHGIDKGLWREPDE